MKHVKTKNLGDLDNYFYITSEYGRKIKIPIKYKLEVMDMIKERKFECLNNFIEKLKMGIE